MDLTYVNIGIFVFFTLFYFLKIKPKPTLDDLQNNTNIYNYNVKIYFRLFLYFLTIVVSQFLINIGSIIITCGGSASKNINAAALYTFFPWILIFGVIVVVLVAFPGFKSAFSDVIGYAVVYSGASKLMNELFIERNVEAALEPHVGGEENPLDLPKVNTNIPVLTDFKNSQITGFSDVDNQNVATANPVGQPVRLYGGSGKIKQRKVQKGGQDLTKKQIEDASDALVKLFGDKSILINQMVPENFQEYWSVLQPLIKPQYRDGTDGNKNDNTEEPSKKQQLLDLIVTRDNVGEGMWYIYTAVTLITIVQYYITSRGCKKDMQTMQDEYQTFLQNETKTKEKQAATQTNYTITT